MRIIDADAYCTKVCGYKGRCRVEQKRSCCFFKNEYELPAPAEMSDLRSWFVRNFETNDDWYELILKQLNTDFIVIPRGGIK